MPVRISRPRKICIVRWRWNSGSGKSTPGDAAASGTNAPAVSGKSLDPNCAQPLWPTRLSRGTMMRNDGLAGRCLTMPFACIPDLLEHQARCVPDAPAIFAPARAPLSYSLLYQHIGKTAGVLRSLGIGRHDRVAV